MLVRLFRKSLRNIAAKPVRSRPSLEALEDRCVPSTAGYLDPTFGAPNGYVVTNPGQSVGQAVAVQPTDGKIVVAGYAPNKTGQQSIAVLRYNPNGTPDATFGSGGTVITTVGKLGSVANGVAIQADGKIVVSGFERLSLTPGSLGFDHAIVLARYNANGTLDTTFGTGRKPTGIVITDLGPGDDEAGGPHIQSWDGKIVLTGFTTRSGTGNDVAVLRYNPDGSLDGTFGNGGIVVTSVNAFADNGSDLAFQPDHQIVVVGGASNSGIACFLVLRYNGSNGSLDTSFNGTGMVIAMPAAGPGGGQLVSPHDYANALALQADGSIVAGGSLYDNPGTPEVGTLARFTSTGALDATFGNGGFAYVTGLTNVTDLAIHPNTGGEIDVAGYLTTTNGTSAVVARLQTNGSLDTSFGTSAGLSYLNVNGSPDNRFRGMALQSDGSIVVTGYTQVTSPTHDAILVARYLGAGPQIGSFTASPNPVTAGSNVTLTAASVTDPNPGGNVTQVAFYQDSNGDGKLEPGSDTLLGYGTRSGSTWTLSFSTAGWAAAVDMLFAQAKDNYGLFSDPFALTLTVQ